MKAKVFDHKFDNGNDDIISNLDLKKARRVNQEAKRINVDFPAWVVESLDQEAERIGVTRQSLIKVWLVERLRAEANERASPYQLSEASFDTLMEIVHEYKSKS